MRKGKKLGTRTVGKPTMEFPVYYLSLGESDMSLSLWCVIGGWNYEGEDARSLRLFESEALARLYETELLGPGEDGFQQYDYVEVFERVVG